MFGTNQIVGQKFFSIYESEEKVMITSVFLTLQGEGPFAGRPAVFVRASKCNLACDFCDTLFEKGDTITFMELTGKIVHCIHEYWIGRGLPVPSWANLGTNSGIGLVITGGEPTLQPRLTQWVNRHASMFAFVQVETNGLIYQNYSPAVKVVVSPKSPNGKRPPSAIGPNVREQLAALKFVLSADPESPYHTVPDWALSMRRLVYVSPMNVYLNKSKLDNASDDMASRSTKDEVVSFWGDDLDREANRRNHEYCARYALDNGLKLSLQTHLYASLP